MLSALSPESIAILDDIRRIVQVLHESSRIAELRLGVNGARLFLLRNLAEAPALSLTALAARTRAQPGTVSVVINRLIEAGLVQRCTPEGDGSGVQFALTREGERMLARAPMVAQDRLIEGIEHLAPDQRRKLAQTLHTLILEMHLDDELPVMFFEGEVQDHDAAAQARRAKRLTRWDEP